MFCVSVVRVAVGRICTLDKAGRILTWSLQCLITKCTRPRGGRAGSSGHARLRGGTCARAGNGLTWELERSCPGMGIAPATETEGVRSSGRGGEGGRGWGGGANRSRKMTSPFSQKKRVEKGRKCLEEHQRNAVSSGGTGASGAVPQSEVPDGPCVSRASRALSVVRPQPGGAEPSVSIGTKFPGRSQGLWVGRRPSSSAERLRGGRQPPPPN